MSHRTANSTTHRNALHTMQILTAASFVLLAACGGDGGPAGGANNNNGARQVQLGQNLDGQPANNTVRCADGVPAQTTAYAGFFIRPTDFQPAVPNANSCTLITYFDGAQVPTSGTVVSANIKVGAVTGPMRFVRVRVLFQRNLPQDVQSCCSVEQVGVTFTPTPNAITTVPLNFAMTHEAIQPALAIGTTIAQDMVALEVLSPNVPIPGTWVNPPFGPNFVQANYIYWPAFTLNPANAGQNKRATAGFSGFMPSYNLNFVAGNVAGRIVEP
ncbi:MAG: hypothetical protein H7099_07160 [Gemmatimonadaceae bacterium]|nr:hypothetical protein [Gemmatimonadaceae bacterium]